MKKKTLEEMMDKYREFAPICLDMKYYLSQFADLDDLLENGDAEENAELAYWYISQVIKKRCPELEDVLKGSPKWISYYMVTVIGERCYELEEYLKGSPEFLIYYIIDVIGERCPELEEYLKGSPEWLSHYITDAIGERCPELEVFIKPSEQGTSWYNSHFNCEI